MNDIREIIFGYGHKNVQASHRTTLEFTKDTRLSKKGGCIVAVGTDKALADLCIEFKEKMRVAGGQYSDFMRQLEVAETEINEAEANIKSVEARHNRGEISLEAYRNLSADYQRRKENAETTIDGVLLRLREETR